MKPANINSEVALSTPIIGRHRLNLTSKSESFNAAFNIKAYPIIFGKNGTTDIMYTKKYPTQSNPKPIFLITFQKLFFVRAIVLRCAAAFWDLCRCRA